MNVGIVREVWRYPVKSMGGERMEACEVTQSGLAGDRGWALRDEASREIRGGKKWPALMQCQAGYVGGGTDTEAVMVSVVEGVVEGTDTEFRSAEPPQKSVSVPVPAEPSQKSVSVPVPAEPPRKSVSVPVPAEPSQKSASVPMSNHVSIRFPDGSVIASDDANANDRLSEFLGARVSLWPVQPASDKAHYRRRQPGASVVGWMGRSKTFRRVLQAVAPYTPLNAQLRGEFSREADEPIPDLAELPGELFEFATPPGTYFDAFPIHLLTTASLDAMRKVNPEAAWDARRFRPNLLIETAPGIEGLVEREWGGRTIRIGGVELQCTIPTVRCGMTMHAQDGLPKDPSILRSIVRDAAQNFGIYATVVDGGRVQVGDSVEIIS
ncbi:MAG: MOSC domain-containing protein [Candidatus Hydrogenedentes bacterium]|nr:MOSC domain-containing protein [Candidatus Hydrogenedentota bacterium]